MADPVTMSAAATGGATALSAIGSIIGGNARADADERQAQLVQQGAEFTAKQQEYAAAESRGAAVASAFEKRRTTKLAMSTLQARAAAGGDVASEGDALKLGGEIAGRGEYQALADLYVGENRARGLEDEATATRMNAAAKAEGLRAGASGTRTGSLFSAGGTILSGVSQIGRDQARIKYG